MRSLCVHDAVAAAFPGRVAPESAQAYTTIEVADRAKSPLDRDVPRPSYACRDERDPVTLARVVSRDDAGRANGLFYSSELAHLSAQSASTRELPAGREV
jgi:hypothetical protein